MTQFPHDEFDNVPPYQSDEIGKHRTPGAAAAAGSGAGGAGLKWIGLLAALVLVVGAFAYWIMPMLTGDDDQPTAEEGTEQEQAEGEEDAEDAAEEAAEEGAAEEDEAGAENGDDEAAEDETEDGAENGAEEGTTEDEDEDDEDGTEDEEDDTPETSVTVYNYGAPEGAAGSATSQLTEAGHEVSDPENWEGQWSDVQTPLVIYPSDEYEQQAQEIAEQIGGAGTMQSDAWQSIAVVVGPEGVQ